MADIFRTLRREWISVAIAAAVSIAGATALSAWVISSAESPKYDCDYDGGCPR